jgi:hypothetical protein
MTGVPAMISEGGSIQASGALGSLTSSFLQEVITRAAKKISPHLDNLCLMVSDD